MTSHTLPSVHALHRPWWSRALDAIESLRRGAVATVPPTRHELPLEALSTQTLADVGASEELIARGHARDSAHRANQLAALRGLRSEIGFW